MGHFLFHAQPCELEATILGKTNYTGRYLYRRSDLKELKEVYTIYPRGMQITKLESVPPKYWNSFHISIVVVMFFGLITQS